MTKTPSTPRPAPGSGRQTRRGAFDAALRKTLDDARARLAVSSAERRLAAGDLEGAVLEFESAAQIATVGGETGLGAHDRAAGLLADLGRHAEAITHLCAVLEHHPGDAAAWRRLAHSLRRRRQTDDEIEALRQLLSVEPGDLYAHQRLGLVLSERNAPAEAAVHLRAWAEATPDDQSSWRRLAGCLMEIGDTAGQIEVWNRVLSLHPNNEKAIWRLRSLGAAPVVVAPRSAALDGLSATLRDDGASWKAVTKSVAGLGGFDVQIAAWRALLADRPDDLRIHSVLSRALLDAGLRAEASAHLRTLAEASSAGHKPWKALARHMRDIGDVKGETEAWQGALAAEPGYFPAHVHLSRLLEGAGDPADEITHLRIVADTGVLRAQDRLAQVLCDLDRTADALTYLRALAEAAPHDPRPWRRLARALTEIGDLKGAIDAWARPLKLNPDDLEAEERHNDLLRRAAPNPADDARTRPGRRNVPPLKITVLGNCQAFGMAQCLRALSPEADVSGFIWNEIRSDAHAEQIARGLEGQDLVISQFTGKSYHGALRTERLRERLGRLALFPNIHFTGFHPDLIWMPKAVRAQDRRHRFGTWHSALILAAFVRGVPETIAADLFNAYIYGALGYFDEYAKAEQHHLDAARALDIDLEPQLASWRREGVFVHVPNHPVIGVFWSMAQLACEQLGLTVTTAAAMPEDRLRHHNRWPVYPEIAKRLGVQGSLRFEPLGAGTQAVDLQDLVRELYQVYARAEPESLCAPRVLEIADALEREGV